MDRLSGAHPASVDAYPGALGRDAGSGGIVADGVFFKLSFPSHLRGDDGRDDRGSCAAAAFGTSGGGIAVRREAGDPGGAGRRLRGA